MKPWTRSRKSLGALQEKQFNVYAPRHDASPHTLHGASPDTLHGASAFSLGAASARASARASALGLGAEAP